MIKLISESFVRPKHMVEAAKHPLYLGPVELFMLFGQPIQKGLLFALPPGVPNNNLPTSTIISTLVGKLKHSLALALHHFYPLAGRLETRKLDDEDACVVYVDCDKGPGARLIQAAARGTTVADVLSPVDVPKLVHGFFDLGEKFVNYDCHEHARPILSIQVTELVNGVFIGFTMCHTVADGTSFMHFVSMLNEIYCSDYYHNDESCDSAISRVPVFDYKPWCEGRDTAAIKLPKTQLEKAVTRRYPGPLRERIFHFSSTSLARLKAMANEECKTTGVVLSSFQALAALMWRSITKARTRNSPPSDKEATSVLQVLMNARTRFDPTISDDYFGDFISHAEVICKADELLGHDLGWAALRLNERIVEQDAVKGLCDGYKWLANHLSSVGLPCSGDDDGGGGYVSNRVVIGGSARFDMYGLEFGLGKAVAVRMGFASKQDGKITANSGREGGGSVDLEVSLTAENMAALETDQEFLSFVSSRNN